MSVNKYEGANSIQAVYKTRDVREPKAVKIVHPLIQRSGEYFLLVKFAYKIL